MEKLTIKPQIFQNGRWRNLEGKGYSDEWQDIDEIYAYRESTVVKEVGAYVTWFDDPTKNVMVHFITHDSDTIECEYRILGSEDWQSVSIYSDKEFPLSQYRVLWFKLENLEGNSYYEVRLKNSAGTHIFKTMNKSSRNITTALISDQLHSISDFNNDEGSRGINTIYNNDVDYITIAGDMVHDDGRRSDAWLAWWNKVFEIQKERNLMIPFVVCIGNHDGRVENEDGTFKSLLWVSGGATIDDVIFPRAFFSNVEFSTYGVIDISDYFSTVFLDSFHTQQVLGSQTNWLTSTLQDRVDRHVFPFFHVSPYPAYYQYAGPMNKAMRENWTTLFSEKGIKIVGNGHEHVRLATKKVINESVNNNNGVVYTGQGYGMGTGARTSSITEDTWYVDFLNKEDKGMDIIEFKTSGSVELRKLDLDGNLLYSVVL